MIFRKAFKLAGVYIILAGIVGFSAYLYRNELKILVDPNDNIFQFGLINWASRIWQQVFIGRLSPFYLIDHFNPIWSEGFSLPMYYSHLPQAIISLTSFIFHLDIYQLFNQIKFVLLILLPVSFFFGARILGFSELFSLITAFFSQLIFTNGFYGIDSSSYLWRGWGLTSQLFAVFFLPLAFGYAYSYLNHKKDLLKAIIFNFIVAQSHSGVFLMLALSYPVIAITNIVLVTKNSHPELDSGSRSRIKFGMTKGMIKRLLILGGLTFVSLAYFFIPFFLYGNYRNFSYWDPIWKFESFGVKQSLIWFLNGDMFDYNRLPFLSILAGLGFLTAFLRSKSIYKYLAILFVIYWILYLGKATFGSVINLIPGLSEFHLSRFIVMVQFIGLFLAAHCLESIVNYIINVIPNSSRLAGQVQHDKGIVIYFILIVILAVTAYYLEKPNIKYAEENNSLIIQGNQKYQVEKKDYLQLTDQLAKLPLGRIYAGRPGNWGRNFGVSGIPLYMLLSKDGFPVIGFAPESWSPNSEYDQFFDENDQNFYNLYNIRYLIVPDNFKAPSFAKLLKKYGQNNLYHVPTTGWFSLGTSQLTVSGKKQDFFNIVHLWLNNKDIFAKDYPRISFNNDRSSTIRLIDESKFMTKYSDTPVTIWEQYPLATIKPTTPSGEIKKTTGDINGQNYTAAVRLDSDCRNCILVFKNTFHPDWRVTVNGKTVKTYPVFPFYIGIPVEKAGDYVIIAEYRQNWLKMGLFYGEIIIIGGLIIYWFNKKRI